MYIEDCLVKTNFICYSTFKVARQVLYANAWTDINPVLYTIVSYPPLFLLNASYRTVIVRNVYCIFGFLFSVVILTVKNVTHTQIIVQQIFMFLVKNTRTCFHLRYKTWKRCNIIRFLFLQLNLEIGECPFNWNCIFA